MTDDAAGDSGSVTATTIAPTRPDADAQATLWPDADMCGGEVDMEPMASETVEGMSRQVRKTSEYGRVPEGDDDAEDNGSTCGVDAPGAGSPPLLRLRLPYPAPGAFAAYDAVVARCGERVAIRHAAMGLVWPGATSAGAS